MEHSRGAPGDIHTDHGLEKDGESPNNHLILSPEHSTLCNSQVFSSSSWLSEHLRFKFLPNLTSI